MIFVTQHCLPKKGSSPGLTLNNKTLLKSEDIPPKEKLHYLQNKSQRMLKFVANLTKQRKSYTSIHVAYLSICQI